MRQPRTGAERYFAEQKKDPEFQAVHEEAARRIAAVDTLVRSIEKRRVARGISKAELARRAGMLPEAVRRLFSASSPNPTATTLIALAHALDLELVARPTEAASKPSATRTVAAKKTASSSVQENTLRRRKNSQPFLEGGLCMDPFTASTAVVRLDLFLDEEERLALAGFLAGYRGLTRDAYALDLRQFLSFCTECGIKLFEVRRAHIESFGRLLEERGRAQATVARRLCTVAGFYRYAEEEVGSKELRIDVFIEPWPARFCMLIMDGGPVVLRCHNDPVNQTVLDSGDGLARCPWGLEPPEYRRYHDEEWGHPVLDDTPIFEKLCLEGFQAGLSWLTILRKREAFRAAFWLTPVSCATEARSRLRSRMPEPPSKCRPARGRSPPWCGGMNRLPDLRPAPWRSFRPPHLNRGPSRRS